MIILINMKVETRRRTLLVDKNYNDVGVAGCAAVVN